MCCMPLYAGKKKTTCVLVGTATCMLAVTVQTGSWILTTLETLKNVK